MTIGKAVWAVVICVAWLASASADGLNDIEFIPPGEYQVQAATESPRIAMSARLADFIRLPNQRTVLPLSSLPSSSVSPERVPTHVHRFYYSGNSEFQCPILEGGRTRIVTVHPATGEPIEFFVTLAAGAPRVFYSKKHFAYVYKDHRTVVNFPSVGPWQKRVTVQQQNRPGLKKRQRDVSESIDDAQNRLRSTHFVQSLKSVREGGASVARGAGVLIDRSLGSTIDTTRRITDLIPGKRYLQSLGDQRPYDVRDTGIRDVQRAVADEGRFIAAPN